MLDLLNNHWRRFPAIISELTDKNYCLHEAQIAELAGDFGEWLGCSGTLWHGNVWTHDRNSLGLSGWRRVLLAGWKSQWYCPFNGTPAYMPNLVKTKDWIQVQSEHSKLVRCSHPEGNMSIQRTEMSWGQIQWQTLDKMQGSDHVIQQTVRAKKGGRLPRRNNIRYM